MEVTLLKCCSSAYLERSNNRAAVHKEQIVRRNADYRRNNMSLEKEDLCMKYSIRLMVEIIKSKAVVTVTLSIENAFTSVF